MVGEKDKSGYIISIAAILVGLGLVFAIRNRRRIVRFSESLIGQTEVRGNLGFSNKEFQALMEEVGWDVGDPWCVYFAKLVWYNMAPVWLKKKILKKVSGSSLDTWERLKDDPSFVISAIPQAGDMAIWARYVSGVPDGTGHAGIVTELGYGNFTTIEGNTNELGGSEGYIVAEKTRAIDFKTRDGLRLLGFIRFA